MKSTIYNQTCTCGRPGCPITFAANKSRKYACDGCSKYVRMQNDARKSAERRAAGTDTISKRRATVETRIPSNYGVKDSQPRQPAADWPERRESIRAKYGVKLPKPGEYTI